MGQFPKKKTTEKLYPLKETRGGSTKRDKILGSKNRYFQGEYQQFFITTYFQNCPPVPGPSIRNFQNHGPENCNIINKEKTTLK